MPRALPVPADLVMCRALGNAKPNRFGQRVLRPSRAPRYSHVAVVVNGSYLVHSTPKDGVHFAGLHEFLLCSDYARDWSVFRHRVLEERVQLDLLGTMLLVLSSADYFLRQKYQYGIHVPEHLLPHSMRNRSFCSQLAQRIYAKLDIDTGVLAPDPSRVLPVDFQVAVDTTGYWTDVTPLYRQFLESASASPELLAASIKSEQLMYSIREKQMLLEFLMAKRLQRSIDDAHVVDQMLGSIDAQLSGLTDVLGLSRHPRPPKRSTEHGEHLLQEAGRRNWQVEVLAKRPGRKQKRKPR